MKKKTKSELIYEKNSLFEFMFAERKKTIPDNNIIQACVFQIDSINKEIERRELDL